MSSNKVKCECGATLSSRSMTAHKKTARHLDAIKRLLPPPPSSSVPLPLSHAPLPRLKPVTLHSMHSLLVRRPTLLGRLLPQPHHQLPNQHTPEWLVECVNCSVVQDEKNFMCSSCGNSTISILEHHTPPTSETSIIASIEEATKQTTTETVVSSEWPECCICMDKKSNVVLIPCGHMCVCDVDAEKLKSKYGGQCPVCRQTATLFQRVYM